LSKTVGEGVFELTGDEEGASVGSALLEGADDALGAGEMVGTSVGSEVMVGPLEGTNEGISDGISDGFSDGISDGFSDGLSDGISDGMEEEEEGGKVGTAVGKDVAGGLLADDDPSYEKDMDIEKDMTSTSLSRTSSNLG
jgi:hypothetical protein